MRIGIMLRAMDERGGVGVYTYNVARELLAIDRQNEYVLFYASDAHLGKFAQFPNVQERVVRASRRFIWDQVCMPLACWREGIDLVFHPKFTAPLLAPCKAVMTLHGADWLIPEYAQYYARSNVLLMRVLLPLYCRKCCKLISVSELTTQDFNRALKLPPGKVQTVYFGPAKHFRRIADAAELARVKARYALPDSFILTLSGYDRGRRKNIHHLLEAYRLFHGHTPHRLVVGGRDCDKFRADYGIPSDGYGRDILFPGWIDQADLPAIYSLASVYLYPSNVEAFPIPIAESMACGTPIITSNRNGLKELAGDAARFVDADKPAEIAAALDAVLGDAALQQRLSQAGLARSKLFSWDRCAQETLKILNAAGAAG